MDPVPLVVVAGALIVISFLLLTPAFRRWLSRAYPSDPFQVFEAPGPLPLHRVHFTVPIPALRAGVEGQGHLSRYRVISATEIYFAPRHQWVLQDRGWLWWPAPGSIVVVPGGVDAAFLTPTLSGWSRPLGIALGAVLGIVMLPASLIWGRGALQAQVEDVLEAVTRDASQLTKPAQATV